MTSKETWFITGAGRGMGVGIARAALAAGHAVVATGRDTDVVRKALGEPEDLLVVELDITSLASADLDSRGRRTGVLLRLRRFQVRRGGVDGVA